MSNVPESSGDGTPPPVTLPTSDQAGTPKPAASGTWSDWIIRNKAFGAIASAATLIGFGVMVVSLFGGDSPGTISAGGDVVINQGDGDVMTEQGDGDIGFVQEQSSADGEVAAPSTTSTSIDDEPTPNREAGTSTSLAASAGPTATFAVPAVEWDCQALPVFPTVAPVGAKVVTDEDGCPRIDVTYGIAFQTHEFVVPLEAGQGVSFYVGRGAPVAIRVLDPNGLQVFEEDRQDLRRSTNPLRPAATGDYRIQISSEWSDIDYTIRLFRI